MHQRHSAYLLMLQCPYTRVQCGTLHIQEIWLQTDVECWEVNTYRKWMVSNTITWQHSVYTTHNACCSHGNSYVLRPAFISIISSLLVLTTIKWSVSRFVQLWLHLSPIKSHAGKTQQSSVFHVKMVCRTWNSEGIEVYSFYDNASHFTFYKLNIQSNGKLSLSDKCSENVD